MPLLEGVCSSHDLSNAILAQYGWSILSYLTKAGLSHLPHRGELSIAALCQLPKPTYSGPFPLVTVVVCTRNRTDDLKQCLDAILKLNYPNVEYLVVDNAPSDDRTAELVQKHYPQVCYVQEPKPGLSWARNRAIAEAKGEIIAYTDDDVIVDPDWVLSIVKVFTSDPEVMAVTGLVAPYELETESQILFERHGGFGRGFLNSRRYQIVGDRVPKHWLGGGQFGTGANMAYRRDLFDLIGGFNVALGAGTLSTGCEDHEMYFRVLKSGYALVYEPSALVWHRHRRTYEALRSQLASDGIGLYSYFTCTIQTYPDERWDFVRLALWWLWYGNLRWLWISLKYPNRYPRDLILAELKGCFVGLGRYRKALKVAAKLANDPAIAHHPHRILAKQQRHFPDADSVHTSSSTVLPHPSNSSGTTASLPKASTLFRSYQIPIAVRMVDISRPLQPLVDVLDYEKVRIFVTHNRQLLGKIDLHNGRQPITTARLYQVIGDELSAKLLELGLTLPRDLRWAKAMSTLSTQWTLKLDEGTTPVNLPPDIPVSIVVATYDRPNDLRRCLAALLGQNSTRPVEIIVVDNHPA
ncbi:MAG: glycosyltransferase family 2 protein, partial [Cyanobacteria bacterium]|nr:glycosyltransferase family 2 protein [Cyanobacteriota bacterium]MDW8203225.1 glycosyltransferase family 2 protein [Cyanobacteriota bacterium SKYGB_h_bin112]